MRALRARAGAFALALGVLVVLAVKLSPQDDSNAVELSSSSREYHAWLRRMDGGSHEFDKERDAHPVESLRKMHAMLSTASRQLASEIGALRKAQNAPAQQQQQSVSGGGGGGGGCKNCGAAKKEHMPKGFSANAIADALTTKLRAYEKVREKAARYLLKDIAKTIIGSVDKGKISLKGDKKGKEGEEKEGTEAERKKKRKEEEEKRKRERRERAKRRRERRRRREEREHRRLEEQLAHRHKSAPNTSSNDRKYEVNRGRYVVVVNQRNVDGRTGPVQVQKEHFKKNHHHRKGDHKRRRRGRRGEDDEDRRRRHHDHHDHEGEGEGDRDHHHHEEKDIDTKKASKFHANDKVDRRLARIAKIAMDSVKRLRMQRHELRQMRRARRRIIREVTRRRRHRTWKKEVHIQAPIIVMSRDGHTITAHTDKAVHAAKKAVENAKHAQHAAKAASDAADKASAHANKAASSAAAAAAAHDHKEDKAEKEGASHHESKTKSKPEHGSSVNKNSNNNNGDVHVHGPMVVINAAKGGHKSNNKGRN